MVFIYKFKYVITGNSIGKAIKGGYISKIEEIQKESIDKAHRVYDGNGVSLDALRDITRNNLITEKNKADAEALRKAKLKDDQLKQQNKKDNIREKYEHKNKIDFSKFDEDDYKE